MEIQRKPETDPVYIRRVLNHAREKAWISRIARSLLVLFGRSGQTGHLTRQHAMAAEGDNLVAACTVLVVKVDPAKRSKSSNAIPTLVQTGQSGRNLILVRNHAVEVFKNAIDRAKEAMIAKESRWKATPAMKISVQAGLITQIGRLAQLVAAKA